MISPPSIFSDNIFIFALGLILSQRPHARLVGMSDAAFRSVGAATTDVVPVSKRGYATALRSMCAIWLHTETD